jgi:hypothetical protein
MARWAGRKGRAWRALCAQVYNDPAETHCIRCGKPVDKTIVFSQYLPKHLRPQARSVDHIVAMHMGGAKLSRDNVAIAHYGCNARHGARVGNAQRAGREHMASNIVVDIDPHSL